MITATITVIRDDREIEVTVSAKLERYGSYNARESGVHVGDWVDICPRIKLTDEEIMMADEALEGEI